MKVPASPYRILPWIRCAIGGEPRTHVALFFTGGLMVRLHTACEALWKQERQA